MKEIILVSPKLGIGGIQRSVTNLANWLTQKGYRVIIISCKKEPLFYTLDEKVIVTVPRFEYDLSYGKLIYYFKLIIYLRNQLKAVDSKIVLSFGEAFNPFVLISSIWLKKKILIADRTSPDYKHSKVILFLRRICYPLAETLIVQSTKSYSYNKKKFKGLQIRVIPNFIKKMDASYSKNSKSILYVGRFAWEKAPQRLIEAFANLSEGHNFQLDMCGDGPMLNSMKELAVRLGVSNRVTFHGRVNNVQEYYLSAGIYVLPSVLEGFPNALLEALSAGIPAICFNTIPYEDIGVHGRDFLVIGEDFESLEEALNLLIIDDKLRTELSINALKLMSNFQDDVIGNKYLKLINEPI